MIRMQRIGRKNDPAFRILVLEKTASPKAGTYTDLLGTYNPKTKALTLAEDRLKDWMGKGAQLSASLNNLLVNRGIIEGKKISTLSKKELEKNKKEEAPTEAEAPAAAAPAAEAEVKSEDTPPAEEAPAEAPVLAEEPPVEEKTEEAASAA